MKYKVCLYFLLACFFPLLANAAPDGGHSQKKAAAKTTIANAAEDDYDVKYLKFDISVSDTSVYIAGSVYSRSVVTADSLTTYVFELDTSLTVDSVFIGGVMLPSTVVSGFVRSVTLPLPLSSGVTFAATVYYHGLPPGGGGGFFNGITHAVSPGGTHMVYTVSDPYVAKNWWPCKQSVQDKIDSVDMYVTVPAHVADGSNGVLVAVDSLTDTTRWQYHWKTRYPIDYYLISIAVARYEQYKSYMHFTGSTDSMLIHNFFLDTASFNPVYKPNFDSLDQMINYFSGLYGRYPFWKEKYGVCYTNLPGGMEHQTMTTIGVPNTYIIAHELGHQWFGDNVTYQDWRDVWLSEGFATFSEQLFFDHFWSPAAAKAHRLSLMNNALLSPCGRVIVTDTTNSDSLFNQRTVYNKAQAVVRMLQYAAPSDSIFFSMLRTYQQTYALGHASTASLKTLAEAAYGYPLDTFFNQWVYGRGYPIYNMSWNQSGNTVYVRLVQTCSCPGYTSHFSTPLELQLHAASADTIIKVYNNQDTQYYEFNWSPAITNVYLNPDVWTLLKLTGTTHDTYLGVGSIQHGEPGVYPNPANNSWQLQGVSEGIALELYNMAGQSLWKGSTAKGVTVIPGKGLPAGEYYLRYHTETADRSLKLVHW